MAKMETKFEIGVNSFLTDTRVRTCIARECAYNLLNDKFDARSLCLLKEIHIDQHGHCDCFTKAKPIWDKEDD